MGSIREYLPWGLLIASLGVIVSQAIEAGRITYGHDVQGFCTAAHDNLQGNRLQVTIHNQHWIWVSCSEPENI